MMPFWPFHIDFGGEFISSVKKKKIAARRAYVSAAVIVPAAQYSSTSPVSTLMKMPAREAKFAARAWVNLRLTSRPSGSTRARYDVR